MQHEQLRELLRHTPVLRVSSACSSANASIGLVIKMRDLARADLFEASRCFAIENGAMVALATSARRTSKSSHPVLLKWSPETGQDYIATSGNRDPMVCSLCDSSGAGHTECRVGPSAGLGRVLGGAECWVGYVLDFTAY